MVQKLHINGGSHLPALIRAVALTDGPVLEMGMGYFSSPFLHWACATKKRPLVSYENNPKYFRFAAPFQSDWHEVVCGDYAEADIERPWDVAFIDYAPPLHRKESVRRLAGFAKYIVVHDTEGRHDNRFRFSEIFPLFRWKYTYEYCTPKTSVLSNLIDLSGFGKGWE